MARMENKIISIFVLINVSQIRTWRLANLIYSDCMSKPNKSNGGRVSAICRAANKSNFLKLDGDIIHFSKNGWSDKNVEKS